MERRELIKLLSATIAAWPVVAQAQQGTPRHIGVLGADATVWNSWTVAQAIVLVFVSAIP